MYVRMYYICMLTWMDGWMDGWREGGMDGWKDGWMSKSLLASNIPISNMQW